MPPPDAPYSLPAVPYLRLRHTLRATASAFLPPFKGSMLRGAFGHALRRTVCTMGPQQPCESCRLRQACVYTRIFETFVEGPPPPLLGGLRTAPRPYVFEPAGEERQYAPGDPLAFDLLLFGQAVDLQAYAQLAVERMAAAGLGSAPVTAVTRSPVKSMRSPSRKETKTTRMDDPNASPEGGNRKCLCKRRQRRRLRRVLLEKT